MRAVGTGKAPEGRYLEDQVVDLPEVNGKVHPDYQSLVDDGWVRLLPPEEDPGRTPVQVANAVVRGDSLVNEDDAAVAAKVADRAHDITHTGDPGAAQGEAQERAEVGQRTALGQAQPATPRAVARHQRETAAGGGGNPQQSPNAPGRETVSQIEGRITSATDDDLAAWAADDRSSVRDAAAREQLRRAGG